MIDKGPRPLAFLDPELARRFREQFERQPGCRFVGGGRLRGVRFDGVAEVVTELDGGETVRGEKLLCALGREANLHGLALENAGLHANARGLLEVDADLRTAVPHVYAVGDVIGPPSLAATAMEQGRRAMRHWLGLPVETGLDAVPIGIYTIPEIASVGFDAEQARARHGGALLGRAPFAELARGQIAGQTDGVLQLVADAQGRRLLGAQIVGDGATELIHVAQMALLGGLPIDAFVDHVFNFPTLAEGYRVAALDVVRQRPVAGAVPVTANPRR
jgi:NAD(P) transhydrogenase